MFLFNYMEMARVTVCMYVCLYVCVYMFVCVCMCVCMMDKRMFLFNYMEMARVTVCVCVCVCVCVYVYICMYTGSPAGLAAGARADAQGLVAGSNSKKCPLYRFYSLATLAQH